MSGWTSEARSFLEAHRVGHLATTGADGEPHVIPICYAVDAAGVLFVADAKPKRGPAHALRRLRNLRENPRAAVVVDDYDDDWTRLVYVLVRGRTRFIDAPEEHRAALGLLRVRYSQYRTMALDDAHAHPVVHIAAERVVVWRAHR